MAVLAGDTLRVELNAVNRSGAVHRAHDHPVLAPGIADKLAGHLGDGKRMIAGRSDGRGKAVENAIS